MGNMKLQKLHDKYMEELEGMYKEGAPIETAKVPIVKDLAKIVYYLGKICEDCEMEEEFPQYGNSYNGRTRDHMGRYSGSPYSGDRHIRMSYDDGKAMVEHRLGDLMMCTNDPFVQSVLTGALNRLRNEN